MRELELCVETVDDCAAAARGGADRIELCAALSEGGVTPSHGLLQEALHAAGPVPVHVLIRPRGGNFVYSAGEFRVLCADVDDALSHGAAGVVLGILTGDRQVDQVRTEELLRLAGSHPVTFHRAFDRTADIFHALQALLDLGCARVLTSGGQPTVSQGYNALAELVRRASGRLRIAAGGGVTLANASRFVEIAGLDLHASLLPKAEAVATADPLWSEVLLRRVAMEDVRRLSRIVHGGI